MPLFSVCFGMFPNGYRVSTLKKEIALLREQASLATSEMQDLKDSSAATIGALQEDVTKEKTERVLSNRDVTELQQQLKLLKISHAQESEVAAAKAAKQESGLAGHREHLQFLDRVREREHARNTQNEADLNFQVEQLLAANKTLHLQGA